MALLQIWTVGYNAELPIFMGFSALGRVAELADALDLGSSGVTRAGSIPVSPTRTHSDSRVLGPDAFFIGFQVASCLGVLAGSAPVSASNEMDSVEFGVNFWAAGGVRATSGGCYRFCNWAMLSGVQ